jgi:hypothetical protein
MLNTARRKRALTIFIAALAASFVGAGSAQGAFGDPSFEACITGETSVGPTAGGGSGACDSNGADTANGADSGLSNVTDVAVSSDGEFLYAAALGDDAVASFSRNPSTGELTYAGCITGNSSLSNAGCAPTPDAQASAADSGLHEVTGLALSPDGESLYAVGQSDDAIVHFDRDTTDGTLAYVGCLTGESDTAVGGGGTEACTGTGTEEAGGANSGMDAPQDLAVTNNSVYVVAQQDTAIFRFARVAAVGATQGNLTPGACRSAETETAVGGGGTEACIAVGSPTSGGAFTGLDSVSSVVVSPDRGSVYTTAFSDQAVTRFDRLTGGGLTYRDCITGSLDGSGSGGTGACADSSSATASGINSGLQTPDQLAVSPDNSSLYVTVLGESGVARFDRDPTTGALEYMDCISGEDGHPVCTELPSATPFGTDSGLRDVEGLAISPDGKSLYTAGGAQGDGNGDDSVAYFERDTTAGPTLGELTYRNCITGELESGPEPGTGACSAIPTMEEGGVASGLDGGGDIVVTPDGKSLYGTAFGDTSVFQLDREDPPETTIDDGPTGVITTDRPTFEFSSDEETELFFADFECSLPPAVPAFTDCTSPYMPPPLDDGAYTFSVRASDTFGNLGNADGMPATRSFTVDADSDPPPPPPPPPPDGSTPPPPPPPGDGGGDDDDVDTRDPKTSIKKHPKKTVKADDNRVKVKFRFESDEPGSSFECKLDKGKWKPCESPKKYKVDDGKHTFKVRATDAADNTDSTAAKWKWEVEEKKS